MLKLLMLADDLTGAMDSSVFFAQQGFRTLIAVTPKTDVEACLAGVPSDIEVLTVNTMTRHVSVQAAQDVVAAYVRAGVQLKVPYIYKKTDSALRGNVGAELLAAYEQSGAMQLPFVPALPGMNRGCRAGILYIDDIPVSESELGRDPFNPVTTSNVRAWILEQMESAAGSPVHNHFWNGAVSEQPGICIYDGWKQEQLALLAQQLNQKGMLRITAGSGGFARYLAEQMLKNEETHPALIEKQKNVQAKPVKPMRFMICGSLSDTAQAQVKAAKQAGRICIALPDTITTEADAVWKQQMKLLADQGNACIKQGQVPIFYSVKPGADPSDDERALAARRMAQLAGEFIRGEAADTASKPNGIYIFGGDTLAAILQELAVDGLMPEEEVLPGVVRGTVSTAFGAIQVWTKAGSFGGPELINELLEQAE